MRRKYKLIPIEEEEWRELSAIAHTHSMPAGQFIAFVMRNYLRHYGTANAWKLELIREIRPRPK